MSRLRFSRALKRSICIEYMQSGKSRKEIAMKYDLPSVNLLSAWIQSCLSPLEIHEKCASLQPRFKWTAIWHKRRKILRWT